MATNGFKPEEKLYGSANFNSQKGKLTAILDENDLDDIVLNVTEEPTTNAGRLAYKRKQGKARRIIYDFVRESLMPNITSLKTTKECYDTLVNLYEKKAPSQKRVLRKWLRTLKLNKDESVGSFFTKIAQVRDQLIAIGIAVDDDDLVQTVVDGLTSSWETFMASVSGRENQPTFERLWHDCIEDGRTFGKVIKEDNLALAAKEGKETSG